MDAPESLEAPTVGLSGSLDHTLDDLGERDLAGDWPDTGEGLLVFSKDQNRRRCHHWVWSASLPRNSRLPERVSRM